MPEDEVAWILPWRLPVRRGPKALGHADRGGVARIDVADEAGPPQRPPGPVPQRRRGLRGEALALEALLEHPAQFLLRVQGAVVDADLPDTRAAVAQVDHQRAMAEEGPAGDVVAKHPSGRACVMWPAHALRPH